MMVSHDILASLGAGFYDEKTAAALTSVLLDDNTVFSPELLDAVSPFLNQGYMPMIPDAGLDANTNFAQNDIQLFPAMVDYTNENDLVPTSAQPYSSKSVANVPYPVLKLKRSSDPDMDAASSFEDESEDSDDEYNEGSRKSSGKRASTGKAQGNKVGEPATKKPRTRPPIADDILLHTDPAIIEKMLVPVRKRRQPTTVDPSLPVEVSLHLVHILLHQA